MTGLKGLGLLQRILLLEKTTLVLLLRGCRMTPTLWLRKLPFVKLSAPGGICPAILRTGWSVFATLVVAAPPESDRAAPVELDGQPTFLRPACGGAPIGAGVTAVIPSLQAAHSACAKLAQRSLRWTLRSDSGARKECAAEAWSPWLVCASCPALPSALLCSSKTLV